MRVKIWSLKCNVPRLKLTKKTKCRLFKPGAGALGGGGAVARSIAALVVGAEAEVIGVTGFEDEHDTAGAKTKKVSFRIIILRPNIEKIRIRTRVHLAVSER